jgi:metal-responsive CopG/Arc/MetJ family transcriptional regulator
MREKASPRATPGQQSNGTRITVSIPQQDYDAVLRMAKEKKVSASWIVRDAVEKYIKGEAPSPPSGAAVVRSKL